jgi:hypothetical protein
MPRLTGPPCEVVRKKPQAALPAYKINVPQMLAQYQNLGAPFDNLFSLSFHYGLQRAVTCIIRVSCQGRDFERYTTYHDKDVGEPVHDVALHEKTWVYGEQDC